MTKIIMQDAIMMVETAVDLTLENITVLNAYAFQVKYLILSNPQFTKRFSLKNEEHHQTIWKCILHYRLWN